MRFEMALKIGCDEGVGRTVSSGVFDDYGEIGFDSDFNPSCAAPELKRTIDDPYYILEVRSKDNGSIPHFHVYTKNRDVQSCICMNMAKYFLHEPYQKPLAHGVIKALNIMLDKVEKKNDGKTNWELLSDEWNKNPERNKKVTQEVHPVYAATMPNYNQVRSGENQDNS